MRNDATTTRRTQREPRVVLEQVDEIILGGVKIQVRGQDLPLERVQLDPMNPRLANTVLVSHFGTGAALQEGLQELLWQDPDVHGLYRAVLANQGLIERIIVRHNGVVAEGNCRTVVFRKLQENFPKDSRWKTIPARVLPADITDRQVAILLGELHVGGKNVWSAFEKAGHIHKLFTQFGLSQEEIAKLLKTSKTAVNHHIRAFEAMKEKYLPAFPGPGAVKKFSHFLELYKKPELREWVTHDSKALDLFVDWVGNNKIAEGAGVRDLRDIVTNPQALAAFTHLGRDAAMKLLEQDRPELTSALFKLMIQMTEALDESRLDEIQKVRKDKTGGTKGIVRRLKQSLDRFVDLCDGLD